MGNSSSASAVAGINTTSTIAGLELEENKPIFFKEGIRHVDPEVREYGLAFSEDKECLEESDIKHYKPRLSSVNANWEKVKKRVKKNFNKRLLPRDDEISLEEDINNWMQTLTDPRSKMNKVIEEWFQDSPSSDQERQFQVAVTLSGNPNQATRIIAANFVSSKIAPYNALHTSLQINDRIFDWRDNSVTFPRPANLSSPLIVLSLGFITIKRVGREIFESPALNALCDGLREWNLNKEYDRNNCNCTHYFDDMYRRLVAVEEKNIVVHEPNSNDKSLVKFFELVRHGNVEKIITKDMTDLKLYDGHGKKVSEIIFKTHAQLDDWAVSIFESRGGIDTFKQQLPGMFELLKSFDRAFQVELEKLKIKEDDIKHSIVTLEETVANSMQQGTVLSTIQNQKSHLAELSKWKQECVKGKLCPFHSQNESPLIEQ